MILFRSVRCLLALMGLAVLCGCFPPVQGDLDEENEAHFKAGRARVNSLDYHGAIEAFGKALEVNPRSAAAHFELGSLYVDKEPDPAAAIYHFEQYLKLRPQAENADIIKQWISSLKQELAKAVLPLPSTPGVQRELEQLAEDNRRLREENTRLTDEVSKWRAFAASRGANVPDSPGSAPLAGGQTSSATQQGSSGRSVGTSSMRTHRVQAGETPAGIARKYGVKLDALMSANPGLNPRRMQVGQTLNIPAP